MALTFEAREVTDTTIELVLTLDAATTTATSVTFSLADTQISETVTIPTGSSAGDEITGIMSGLTPSTTYHPLITNITGPDSPYALAPFSPEGVTTKATGYNDPRTATQEQWEDLAARVKAKVNTAKIENKAVTTEKINWDSVKSRTPFIVNLSATSDILQDYTSDKGNTYSIFTTNSGSGAKIVAGAEDVQKVVTTVSFRGATSGLFTNREIGLHGVFTNGTTQRFKFISGLKNGTAINPVQKDSASTATYVHFDYNNTNITFSGAVTRTEWVRVAGSNVWYGFTEINYYGSNTTYYGVAIASMADSGAVPTVYFPETQNKISNASQSIEIYE